MGKYLPRNQANIEADMKRRCRWSLFCRPSGSDVSKWRLSSHFIGYAVPDKDENGLVGKLGLESAYNDILSGKDGKIIYQKIIFKSSARYSGRRRKAVDGQDIYTTLDSRLQSYLETLMDQVNEEYQPEELTAVLMKAKPEKSWQWDNDLLSILKQWKD